MAACETVGPLCGAEQQQHVFFQSEHKPDSMYVVLSAYNNHLPETVVIGHK